jgi:signal transduction histidine kinase
MVAPEAARAEKRTMAEQTAVSVISWHASLAAYRAVLGVLCTMLAFGSNTPLAHNSAPLWIAYTIYALLAVFGKSLEKKGYMLLSLLIDVVFFLICSALPLEYNTGITSLFYLFILMSAAMLHTYREIFFVVIGTTLFFFLARPLDVVVLSPTVLLSGTAVTVMALQRQALQDRLRMAARQASLFRSEAEHAREGERQRIAHDFHDGPLQCFVGFQMRLQVIRTLLERDPGKALVELDDLQGLARTQSEEIRTFVRSMRPPEIDGAGLVSSIKKLAESFGKDANIQTTFVGGNARVHPPDEVAKEILQIAREALHNIQKHAAARNVTVGVARDADGFELSVDDDGRGFPFSGAYSLEELELLNKGPLSIRSRVKSLKGEMLLESEPGKRSSLRIRIPL